MRFYFEGEGTTNIHAEGFEDLDDPMEDLQQTVAMPSSSTHPETRKRSKFN